MDIFSTTLLLVLIMDPLGNMPIFISVLKGVPENRRLKVLIRELLIALLILLIFLLSGEKLLSALNLDQEAVSIAGGIILFIIALRLIFPSGKGSVMGDTPEGEPFIVPMATPMIAGPSILATLILMGKQYPGEQASLAVSVFLAWLLSTTVLIMSSKIMKVIGNRGIFAIERLMGMILVMLSVQMLMNGITSFIVSHGYR